MATTNRLVFRRLLLMIGGSAIVVVFFFGTLAVLNYWDSSSRDLLRADHARLLKEALERYRVSRGKYPEFADNSVADLNAALVGGHYLSAIPQDPLWPEKPYRYTTSGFPGSRYGLLFQVERGGIATCVTGKDVLAAWWSNPPQCPF